MRTIGKMLLVLLIIASVGVQSSPTRNRAAQERLNHRLIEAIRAKKQSLIQSLLKGGADVNSVDDEDTPLTLAVREGDVGIAQLLIARGANVNKKNFIGQPPLVCVPSLTKKTTRLRMLRLLLNHGADPDSGSGIGMDADDSIFLTTVRVGQVEEARLMLAKGASVNFVGDLGITPLDEAVRNRDLPMIRLLQTQGAKLGYEWRGNDSRRVERLIKSEHLQFAINEEIAAWEHSQRLHNLRPH